MNQAAAIKRATRQARNAMYDLDRRGVAELLAIYEQAVAEIKGKLAAAVDSADLVPVHQLQELLRQVEGVIDGLASRRNDLVIAAIDEAAALGVRPFTAQGVLAVGGSEAVLTSAAALSAAERAVRFVTEFVYPDELTLSDRLWRLDRGAKEALTRAIGMAVVQGQSATSAAQRFIMDGQPVPGDVEQRLKNARFPGLAKAVDLLANPKGGDGFWQAERVMRTEINWAHGEAFMAAGEDTPGFGGWRYLLSPLHPAPDICDLLSTQNLYGLGPGVYPDRESVPWPAHPNTLSFLEIVFKSEITDADRAGKETALQALQRMAPEIREGALGKTKAEYFDRGLLRTGMIRAPLYAVEQRLTRQGKL